MRDKQTATYVRVRTYLEHAEGYEAEDVGLRDGGDDERDRGNGEEIRHNRLERNVGGV